MNDTINEEDRKAIDEFAQAFATYADQENGDHSYNEDSYTDFKLGAEWGIEYARKELMPKPCEDCNGSGMTLGYENSIRDCKRCEGSGQEPNKELAELKAENQELRMLLNEARQIESETLKRYKEALSRCSECNDLATSREYAKSALSGTKETE